MTTTTNTAVAAVKSPDPNSRVGGTGTTTATGEEGIEEKDSAVNEEGVPGRRFRVAGIRPPQPPPHLPPPPRVGKKERKDRRPNDGLSSCNRAPNPTMSRLLLRPPLREVVALASLDPDGPGTSHRGGSAPTPTRTRTRPKTPRTGPSLLRQQRSQRLPPPIAGTVVVAAAAARPHIPEGVEVMTGEVEGALPDEAVPARGKAAVGGAVVVEEVILKATIDGGRRVGAAAVGATVATPRPILRRIQPQANNSLPPPPRSLPSRESAKLRLPLLRLRPRHLRLPFHLWSPKNPRSSTSSPPSRSMSRTRTSPTLLGLQAGDSHHLFL